MTNKKQPTEYVSPCFCVYEFRADHLRLDIMGATMENGPEDANPEVEAMAEIWGAQVCRI